MPQELADTRVCDLMQLNVKTWDEEILSDLFNTRDAQLIGNVPLSIQDKRDSWLWILDEKGEFSVKSCYRQMVGEYATPDATFWRKLWTLELPGKVRFFLWRKCRLFLPTATLLIDKRVNIDSKCVWCRLEIESVEHVLFECEFEASMELSRYG